MTHYATHPAGYWFATSDDIVVAANPALANMFGWDLQRVYAQLHAEGTGMVQL